MQVLPFWKDSGAGRRAGRESSQALHNLYRAEMAAASSVTQAELSFENPTRIPPKESQCYALLMAYQRGERLTVAVALSKYGVYALSQRNGDLRRKYGWPVQSRTVRTANGADISEYWI